MKLQRILCLTIFSGMLMTLSCSWFGKKIVRVGYVITSEDLSDEDRKVLTWLNDHEQFVPMPIHLKGDVLESSDIDVFWLHIPDSSSYQQWISQKANETALISLVQMSKQVLLTDYAALLPYRCGIESRKPDVQTVRIRDNWLFDKKGLHSWRGHPVFKDLFGGVFIWDSFEDHDLPRIGFFGDRFPAEGKVVAVEKSYITIHSNHRIMLEYGKDDQKVLSVGAFVYFNRPNRLDAKCKRLVENCLLYLDGKIEKNGATYWKESDLLPVQFQISSKGIKPSVKRDLKQLPRTELLFSMNKPEDHFFDLAGRRALVMGRENGGIDELWVHPVRIMRDYQAGIVQGDSIAWLRNMDLSVEIRPESMTRIYQTNNGELKEVIFSAFKKPGALVHYKSDSTKAVKLVIKFHTDLRWMWPYDENALGSIYYGYDKTLNALHVQDETGGYAAIFGGDIKPLLQKQGAFSDILWDGRSFVCKNAEGNQVCHAALYNLDSDNQSCLNLAFVGSGEGRDDALASYRDLLTHPLTEYMLLVNHYENIFNSFVTINSPDDHFNRLWKWTLVGIDRFFVYTPPLGKALVAGYGTSDRGWDGGHKNSGRPGYGWYFGRDAVWSGFAADDYGDFDLVKNQLIFFQKFQDISGKILHELSTSGVVHYDASDATPLYIILAAHYLRASGDLKFIRESWSHIQKAMDFLYSTDTDGDGLIENTNVGHGWVEGGKLWGANTTFYLAGLWTQTLKDAAYMASHLGNNLLEKRYSLDADRIRDVLNTDFWNQDEGFFYYGKYSDGLFNPEKTVLPAVVTYFNLLDDEKVRSVLEHYAGNGFSSDWGVRILSSDSPLFNPTGYHYGSVWPLFTGWTALAEYEYGNSVQGFTHIYNNMYIKNYWAKGFVEEVMNGAEFKPSGVCPHQCWSETNVLHPAITGMIGWKPFALEKRAELKPRFPLHWDMVGVDNLRIGNSRITLKMKRSKNETSYKLLLKEGTPVHIRLFPEIPQGLILDEVFINGDPVQVSVEKSRGLLKQPVEIDLQSESTVILRHRKGVGMIPVMPEPMPGDKSLGYRIIASRLKGNQYTIDLEGKSGSTAYFQLMVNDQRIKQVHGGQVEETEKNWLVRLRIPFLSSKQRFIKKEKNRLVRLRIPFPPSKQRFIKKQIIVFFD